MKLGKGINYSRYCLWWQGSQGVNFTDYMQPNAGNRDKISPIKLNETAEHIKLIRRLGFETVRLPVSFNVWAMPDSTDISQSPYWVVIDNMINLCKQADLKLVIDYHHAPLCDHTFEANKNRIKALWLQIVDRLKNTDPTQVIFEIFNEPNGVWFEQEQFFSPISTDNLVNFYQEIVTSIRNTGGFNQQRKLVVGGNGFYEIGFGDVGLLPFLQRNAFLNDPNIIYTVHFYEPRFFTMQGLDDGDALLPVENVEFPATRDFSNTNVLDANDFFANNYFQAKDPDIIALNIAGKGMGSIEFVKARMMQLKALTDAGLQIWCGEIGVYRHFVDKVQQNPNPSFKGSLERYLKTLLDSLKNANIDWCWWDFEGGMTFFNPVPRLQRANRALNRTTDSPDMLKPFGFAEPYSNEKVDPLMRTLLGLNERVQLSIISIMRNITTKKDTIRAKITCLDEISNIKDFELFYESSVIIRGIASKKFTKKTIIAQKSVNISLTGLDLAIINLRVNHTDGSFMLVLNE